MLDVGVVVVNVATSCIHCRILDLHFTLEHLVVTEDTSKIETVKKGRFTCAEI